MNILFSLNKLHGLSRKIFLYMVELLVVITALSGTTIVYDTFMNVDAPAILHEPAIVSIATLKNGDEVQITRDITIKNIEDPIIISTQLTNEFNDSSFDLNDTKITPKSLGKITTHKLYYVSHLTKGTWCLKTFITWKPKFSLRDHYVESKNTCFNAE